jgi:hypothetical protein
MALARPALAHPATPAITIAALDDPAVEEAPAAELSARDRITFNAGLDALVAGNLAEARSLFTALATEGETATARSAASLIVDRIGGLERRRAAGLVLPPLRPPQVVPPVTYSPPPEAANARAPVLTTTTLLGLALWGWTLPNALGLRAGDSGRAYLGLYMLTAATSFVVPYQITREHAPSPSQLNTIFYGGTRGAAWGLMVSNLLFGDVAGNESDHPKAFAAGLLLGSVGGVVAGSLLAPRLELSPGDARTIAVMGDYGLFLGLTVGHILNPSEAYNPDQSAEQSRVLSTGGLLGSMLGLGGGHLLARSRRNTWGDGEVMRGAGALGALAGATAVVSFDFQDNDKLLLGFMAAGAGLGLAGGDAFVRDASYAPGEAMMVDLALVTGGLGAAGLTYLITSADGPKPYFLAATAGAAIGGGVIARSLGHHPQKGDLATGRSGTPRLTLLPRFGASGPSGLTVAGAF